MKRITVTILLALLFWLPVAGTAAGNGKSDLCTAKDVQQNIDTLRASIEELQATHDTQRGVEMLHEHMAMIIDNQQIILGLLEQSRTKATQKGVECPKRIHRHKKAR